MMLKIVIFVLAQWPVSWHPHSIQWRFRQRVPTLLWAHLH